MKQESRGGWNQLVPWALVVLLLGGLVAIGLVSGPASSPLHTYLKKSESLSTMRIQLLEAIEAEKNAVLATTVEAAQGYADRARQAAEGVEKSRRELAALIPKENAAREATLLQEFNACWLQFRELDGRILDLATQHTNLKAQRLSATQGAHEIERFEEGLRGLMSPGVTAGQGDEVVRLAYEALTAGLKILALHKPHIEAVGDDEMDRLERAIHADDESARKALAALGSIPGLSGDEHWQQAAAAYARFMALTTEVLRLSRDNTNIKSTALSLGKKRLISAQCQETLASLQQSVHDQQFKATR